jgi:hypothetical protein
MLKLFTLALLREKAFAFLSVCPYMKPYLCIYNKLEIKLLPVM